MPDILLTSKFRIPTLHRNLVNRPQLIRRLDEGIVHHSRLILITAPPGYGKSTLLTEWVTQVGYPVSWLSIEKGANNPARFWGYFVKALRTIPSLNQANLGEALVQALQSRIPAAMDELLTDFANELSEIKEVILLVVDDLHNLTEGKIHKDLVFLIEQLPLTLEGLHLVVSSRTDPPWPLARWRAFNELTELRASDLRFSIDEVSLLLNQTLELGLASRDIATLQLRTEGWIAGLQMAALTMQGRLKDQGAEGVVHFVETFSGTNRFILDYLMEEVINQQTTEMRDFLLATSILEQFNAPLCDALLNRHDSQSLLIQAEQANLFLVALDDERKWFRYHQLFVSLLVTSLKQIHPELVAGLHRRASKWYAENNFLSEAICHAIESGDIKLVNEYVSGNAPGMIEYGELLDVQRHFEEIPERQFDAKPWLWVAYAWVKAYVDPAGGLNLILQKAEQTKADSIVADAEKPQIDCQLDAIRAYTAWITGQASLALKYVDLAMENLPGNDTKTKSHLLNTRGLAWQYLGNLPAAIQAFEAAAVAGKKSSKFSEIYAYTNWAFANLLQGQLHQSFALCQQVLDEMDKSAPVAVQLPVIAYAYATLSCVQLEWNHIEPALANARRGVELAENWNQADTLHYTLICLSRALDAAGNLEQALAINQRSMQLAVAVSSWFYYISSFEEIGLNLRKGDIDSAAHRFHENKLALEDSDPSSGFIMAKVSLLYAQERYSDVLQSVEKPINTLEQKGDFWYLIHLLPFQALAFEALGKREKALAILGHCLALAKPEGFVRAFVQRGAPMARLLKEAAKVGIESEYVNKLLLSFNLPVAADKAEPPVSQKIRPASQSTKLIEPLSKREIQILRLLATSLTTPEIARELCLSNHTIRTHVRNIYGKLGVNRRLSAVQRAEELEII